MNCCSNCIIIISITVNTFKTNVAILVGNFKGYVSTWKTSYSTKNI